MVRKSHQKNITKGKASGENSVDKNTSENELKLDKIVEDITQEVGKVDISEQVKELDTFNEDVTRNTSEVPDFQVLQYNDDSSLTLEENIPKSVVKRFKKAKESYVEHEAENEATKEVLQDNLPSDTEETKSEISNQDVETNSKKSDEKRLPYRVKACYRVTEGADEDGNFGVCYKENCTFAHSLEEFQISICNFGSTCRFRKSTKDKNLKSVCKFRHPEETVSDWMDRTGTYLKLPETSVASYKPKEKHPATKENIQNTYSKPCQYVTDSNKGGVCQRDGCTFAHSIEQLKPQDCQHGKECKLRDGRLHPVTKQVLNTKCTYIHPDENFSDWITRTGFIKLLPQTSETSYMPLPKEEFEKLLTKQSEPSKESLKEKKGKFPKNTKLKVSELGKDKSKHSRKENSCSEGQEKTKTFDVGEKLVIKVPSEQAKKEALLSAMRAGFFNIDIIVEK